MIRGYLIALCSGSALDVNTKNFTLFNLIENLSLPAEALGQTLPFEFHFYCRIDPADRGAEFEMRVVRVDEKGATDPGEPLPVRTGDRGHFRLRVTAFRLPRAFGQHLLRVEWRKKGEERWTADPIEWPLSVAPLAGAKATGAGATTPRDAQPS
jgi:hypothetical protein